jgi:hypothetical protein
MPGRGLVVAEVRVKPTNECPDAPCDFCGSEVGDKGLWFVFDDGSDAKDLVLHATCAKLIGTFGNQKVNKIEREMGGE